MDTKYLVALLLVAGLVGGVSNNYIGDYYSDSSEEENNNDIEDFNMFSQFKFQRNRLYNYFIKIIL